MPQRPNAVAPATIGALMRGADHGNTLFNPSGDVNGTGWGTYTASSSPGATLTGGNVVAGMTGAGAFRLDAPDDLSPVLGIGGSDAGASRHAIGPGGTYTFAATILEVTGAAIVALGVEWYNAALTYLGFVPGGANNATPGRRALTGRAPLDARFATVYVRLSSAAAVTDSVAWDRAYFGPALTDPYA